MMDSGDSGAPVRLDDLPLPDYDDYFRQAEQLRLLSPGRRQKVDIPFETSRGCWWGEKHHCTFCGLNGKTMVFRSMSPERVVRDLQTLRDRYGSSRFFAVDNILDLKYLKTVIPQLIGEDAGFDLFYETKANLSRRHFREFQQAGIRRLQPGIESLNTHVLALMHKGTTALQNINCLRWARFHDIDIHWHILRGFPGEQAKDYLLQAEWVSRLVHLQPPDNFGRIWMDRFSPIYFDRDRFPTKYVRPEKSYAAVYPDDVDLDRIAYFFDYEFDCEFPEAAYDVLQERLTAWKAAWRRSPLPALTYAASARGLTITDTRSRRQQTLEFDVHMATIYEQCSDAPRSFQTLRQSLGAAVRTDKLAAGLRELCRMGIMLKDRGMFLSLGLPEQETSVSTETLSTSTIASAQ